MLTGQAFISPNINKNRIIPKKNFCTVNRHKCDSFDRKEMTNSDFNWILEHITNKCPKQLLHNAKRKVNLLETKRHNDL